MSLRIVAYSSELKPLNKAEYKSEIDKAIQQFKVGKVISQRRMEATLKK